MKRKGTFMYASPGFLIWGLLICVLMFGFSGCKKTEQKSAVSQVSYPPLVLAEAVQEDVQLYEICSGKTVAYRSVDIVPRVKGYIEEINYVPGEIVQPGRVLFTIQDFDYEIAKSKAYAQLYQAVTAAKLARKLYESALRTNKISPRTITEDEMAQKEAQYLDTATRVYSCQAEYQYQSQQLYYTRVISPIRGKVQKNRIDVGNLVGASMEGEVLTTVVEMDPMKVQFEVPESMFAQWYAEMVGKTGGPNIGAGKNTEVKEKNQLPASPVGAVPMQAPEIPYASEDYKFKSGTSPSSANITLTVDPENPENVLDTKIPGTPKEPLIVSATPEIPKPEVQMNPKTPDVSGTGLAGERMVADAEEKPKASIQFEVSFTEDGDKFPYHGTLTYADNKVNPDTGTIRVEGEFPNPKYEIYPGRICMVRIPGEKVKNAIIVEEKGVCSDLKSKFVWVINPDRTAEKRYIQTREILPGGLQRVIEPYEQQQVKNIDGSVSIIKTGLRPKERYILEGYQKVRAGMVVLPESGGSQSAVQNTQRIPQDSADKASVE
ncbi:MAG: hypothetical protein Q4C96_07210 [Planctomycetia bacterium]|nr:hypothetical protein [Planctomycetia bacterium]